MKVRISRSYITWTIVKIVLIALILLISSSLDIFMEKIRNRLLVSAVTEGNLTNVELITNLPDITFLISAILILLIVISIIKSTYKEYKRNVKD